MVSRELVLDTIKRMRGSGIDDQTISSTLKDIGLSDKEINEFMSEATGGGGAKKEPSIPPKYREEELEEEQKEGATEGKAEDSEVEKDLEEGEGNGERQGEEELEDEEIEEEELEPEGKEKEEEEEPIESSEFGEEEDEEIEKSHNHERIAQKTAQKLKRHLDDSMETQEMLHSSTHAELAEQRQRLEDMHRNISALHTKVDLAPAIPAQTIAQINAIEKRFHAMEKELVEIRAGTNALSTLLKKILETDREILNQVKK